MRCPFRQQRRDRLVLRLCGALGCHLRLLLGLLRLLSMLHLLSLLLLQLLPKRAHLCLLRLLCVLSLLRLLQLLPKRGHLPGFRFTALPPAQLLQLLQARLVRRALLQ